MTFSSLYWSHSLLPFSTQISTFGWILRDLYINLISNNLLEFRCRKNTPIPRRIESWWDKKRSICVTTKKRTSNFPSSWLFKIEIKNQNKVEVSLKYLNFQAIEFSRVSCNFCFFFPLAPFCGFFCYVAQQRQFFFCFEIAKIIKNVTLIRPVWYHLIRIGSLE